MSDERVADEVSRKIELAWLTAFYGGLLTDKQRQVLALHCEEDLSLAEIAQEAGVSRQGVHDALKNGQRSLEGYEQKLGLVERYLKTETAIAEIDSQIRTMTGLLEGDAARRNSRTKGGPRAADTDTDGPAADPQTQELIARLERIRTIIDQLEE